MVQGWLNDPSSNHGVVIHWSGIPDYFGRVFHSRDLGNKPLLRVEYEPPITPTPPGWTPTYTTPPLLTTAVTWPTPISDDVDPGVELLEAPTGGTVDTPVLISARATDDREVASLQIWVGGVLKETCVPSGIDRTTVECTFEDYLGPGWHVY